MGREEEEGMLGQGQKEERKQGKQGKKEYVCAWKLKWIW